MCFSDFSFRNTFCVSMGKTLWKSQNVSLNGFFRGKHHPAPAVSEDVAPESGLLPLHVTQFLAQSMDWTHLAVGNCWDIFCDIIWTNGVDLETHPIQLPDPQDLVSFEKYGHPLYLGLSMLHSCSDLS